MNIYTFLAILAVCAAFTYATIFIIRVNTQQRAEHAIFIDGLLFKHHNERKDLVDRLMSRDLKEVKQAQAIQATEPRVISKRQNDARVSEEIRKVAEGK